MWKGIVEGKDVEINKSQRWRGEQEVPERLTKEFQGEDALQFAVSNNHSGSSKLDALDGKTGVKETRWK